MHDAKGSGDPKSHVHNFEADWVYLSLSLSANLLSLKHFKTMTITNSLTVL